MRYRAARTHYSKPLPSVLETGRRTVTRAHVAAYQDALGFRIDHVGPRVDVAESELIKQAADLVTAIGLRRGGLHAIGPALSLTEDRELDALIRIDLAGHHIEYGAPQSAPMILAQLSDQSPVHEVTANGGKATPTD